jgi:hypothetical protein
MEVLFERVAGLDIGEATLTVGLAPVEMEARSTPAPSSAANPRPSRRVGRRRATARPAGFSRQQGAVPLRCRRATSVAKAATARANSSGRSA